MIRQIVFGLLFVFALYLTHITSFIQGFNTNTDRMYQEIHYQAKTITGKSDFKLFGPSGKEVVWRWCYLNYDYNIPSHDTWQTFFDALKNGARVW